MSAPSVRRLSILGAVLLAAALPALSPAQPAGRAGAFARMGFGARGLGMGNAMSAVTTGEVASYYNPALPAFGAVRYGAASFSILSLDRYLNFLSYTQSIQPTGGLSIGLINAGVRDIDGRDADGEHTETYSTYENQVYLSFSNRVSDRVSIGVTMKLYHSKLFEGVTTTTVGFDGGLVVMPTEQFALGAAVQDIGSKYKWNTRDVSDAGKETEDKFPLLKRLGAAFSLPDGRATAAVDLEHASGGSLLVRAGLEYAVVKQFVVRGGADRIEAGDDATGVKPSFGFTAATEVGGWTPALSYAYLHESFAPHGFHLITLSAIF